MNQEPERKKALSMVLRIAQLLLFTAGIANGLTASLFMPGLISLSQTVYDDSPPYITGIFQFRPAVIWFYVYAGALLLTGIVSLFLLRPKFKDRKTWLVPALCCAALTAAGGLYTWIFSNLATSLWIETLICTLATFIAGLAFLLCRRCIGTYRQYKVFSLYSPTAFAVALISVAGALTLVLCLEPIKYQQHGSIAYENTMTARAESLFEVDLSTIHSERDLNGLSLDISISLIPKDNNDSGLFKAVRALSLVSGSGSSIGEHTGHRIHDYANRCYFDLIKATDKHETVEAAWKDTALWLLGYECVDINECDDAEDYIKTVNALFDGLDTKDIQSRINILDGAVQNVTEEEWYGYETKTFHINTYGEYDISYAYIPLTVNDILTTSPEMRRDCLLLYPLIENIWAEEPEAE